MMNEIFDDIADYSTDSTCISNKGEDDKFDVIEALSRVAAKWKAVETALSKLNELEAHAQRGDVQYCLADTV